MLEASYRPTPLLERDSQTFLQIELTSAIGAARLNFRRFAIRRAVLPVRTRACLSQHQIDRGV